MVLPLIGALICIPSTRKGAPQELGPGCRTRSANTSQPSYDYYLTPAQVTQADFEQYIQTEQFGAAVYKKLVAQGVDGSQAYSIATGLSTGLTATASGTNLLLVSYTCDHPSLCATVLSQSWQVDQTYSSPPTRTARSRSPNRCISSRSTRPSSRSTRSPRAGQQLPRSAPGGSDADHEQRSPAELAAAEPAQRAAEKTLQTAQGKLATAKGQANSNEISSSSLYSVVDAAHSQGSHLSPPPRPSR